MASVAVESRRPARCVASGAAARRPADRGRGRALGRWETFKWIGETTGFRLGAFEVNDRTLPHLHDIVGQLFEPSRRNGPLLIEVLWDAALFTAKEAAVGFFLGATIGFAIAVVLAHSRLLQRGLPALHRRLPDRPDPGDRADGRDLARRPRTAGLALGLGDRRLPDLLPGHDQHAARAPVRRPARARADALLRREPLADPLEAARARVAAVPLHRAQGLGDRQRRRRDHRRAAGLDPGRPRRRDPQLQPVLRQLAAEPVGDEPRGGALGITFFLAVVLAEKLVVRRAPEHVA